MKINEIKKILESAINNKSIRTIQISGDWGSGKTHLWEDYKKNCMDPEIKNSLYISLFGKKEIDDIKINLAMQSIRKNSITDKIKTLIEKIVNSKFLKKDKNLINLVKEIILKTINFFDRSIKDKKIKNKTMEFIATDFLYGKFIIIDDLERKNDALEISEILGLINELVEKKNARIIILVNEKEIKEREKWELFKEKTIDAEIFINLDSEEVATIAINNKNQKLFSEEIKEASKILKLKNIRALMKSIDLIENTMGNQTQLNKEERKRFIYSFVLISNIYYKTIQDGPTLEYIENLNTKEGEKKPEWDKIMNELGIYASSDLEKRIIEKIKQITISNEKIEEIIKKRVGVIKSNQAQKTINDLIDDYKWDQHKEIDDIKKEVEQLKEIIDYIKVEHIMDLEDLEFEQGIKEKLEEIVKIWIIEKEKNKQKIDGIEIIKSIKRNKEKGGGSLLTDYLERNKHEEPEKEKIPLIDFIIMEKKEIKNKEEYIKNMDTADYVEALKKKEKEKIKKFIKTQLMIKDIDEEWIKENSKKFIEACEKIKKEEPESKIAKILKREVH